MCHQEGTIMLAYQNFREAQYQSLTILHPLDMPENELALSF